MFPTQSRGRSSASPEVQTTNLFEGSSEGLRHRLQAQGQTLNPAVPDLHPNPDTIELPPRPPLAGELPAPLDFLTPSKFKGTFYVDTNRIEKFPAKQIEQDALSTRVILHQRMPALLDTFLKYKRIYGSSYERPLYADMNWLSLATRMIEKRPLCFLQSNDFTRLRNGKYIGAAYAEWDRVGTEAQHLNKHLTLAEYLSYDEIMLSSLLGASAPTRFINSGSRNNCGRPARGGVAHQARGVMVGLAGPRFDRDGQHDSAVICAPPARGDAVVGGRMDPGVRRLVQQWLLPGVDLDARPDPYALDGAFDVAMYKARLRVSFDVLLLEAEARARAAGKDAIVHVVGLGLGVWRKYKAQNTWFIEAFAESLDALNLQYIATVEFGWISGVPDKTKQAVEAAAAKNVIDVKFTQADPCRKREKGKLLVVSWAWDGNSYVGNEYWNGSLNSSSDPAAVCYSTIGELMNPDINPFADRVLVLGLGNEQESLPWEEPEDEGEENVENKDGGRVD